MEQDRYYPTEAHLGLNCMFWNEAGAYCTFPKAELNGRRSCEGVVDDVCLFIKDRREPLSLSMEQRLALRIRPPSEDSALHLPPGETV